MSPEDARDARRAALQRGAEAEGVVARELEAQGYAILARNWRGKGGELDVIAVREGRVRFVEVKARDAAEDGFEAVNESKRRRLIRAAEAWLVENPPLVEACFLVAVVTLGLSVPSIEWLDDAFDGS